MVAAIASPVFFIVYKTVFSFFDLIGYHEKVFLSNKLL